MEMERLIAYFEGDSTSFKRAAGEVLSLADDLEARFKKLNASLKVEGSGGSLTKEIRESLSLQNALNNAAKVEERTKAAAIATQTKSIQLERQRLQLIDQQNRSVKAPNNSNAGLQKANAEIARYQAQQRRAEEQLTTLIQREANKQEKARISAQQRATSNILSELKKIEAEEARAAAAAAKKQSSSGGGLQNSVVGSFVGNLASNAVTKITSEFYEGGAALIDYSAKLEQARIGLITLIGSANDADQHIKELQTFAKTTPFDFDQVLKASQLLQGMGLAAERVVPVLTDVGNRLAAAGKGKEAFERVILQLQQVESVGHITGREIRTLSEDGLPVIAILAEALGKPKEAIVELAKQGRISFDVLVNAIKKTNESNHLGDAMVAQSHTFNGAIENIKDSLLQFGSEAFKPLFVNFSHIADKLAGEVSRQDADFHSIGKAMGEAVGAAFTEAIKFTGRGIVAELKAEIADLQKGDYSQISTPTGFGASLAPDLYSKDSQELAKKLQGQSGADALKKLLFGSGNDRYFQDNKLAEQVRLDSQSAANDKLVKGKNNGYNLPDGAIFYSKNGDEVKYIDKLTNTIKVLSAEIKKVPSLEPQLLPGKEKKGKKAIQYLTAAQLADFAKEYGFQPSFHGGFNDGGTHSVGSKHYLNEAQDVSIRGKSDAEKAFFKAEAKRRGIYVLDEELHPSKLSTAPHYHLEDARLHGKRSAGDVGDFADFQKQFNEKLVQQLRDKSDTLTKADSDKRTRILIDLYKKQGLIPSEDLLRDFTDLAKEEAQKAGTAQTPGAVIAQSFAQNAFGKNGEVSVEGGTLATAAIEQRKTAEDEYIDKLREGLGINQQNYDLIVKTAAYDKVVGETFGASKTQQDTDLTNAQTTFDVQAKQNADAVFVAHRRDLTVLTENNSLTASIASLQDKIANSGINDSLVLQEMHLQNIVSLRDAELQKIADGNRTLAERLRLSAAQTPGYKEIGKDFLAGLPNQVGDTLGNIAQQWDGTWKGLFDSVKKGFAQMLLDLAQQYAKAAIAKLIGSLVGSLIGAIGGGIGAGGGGLTDSPLPSGGGGAVFAAGGGLITGPGTTTSDSILARLSNKEFVQPADSVAYYGENFMRMIQNKQFPKFADGGMVGDRSVFVPRQSDTILSADENTKSGTGGGTVINNHNVINQTIHAPRGMVPAKSARQASEGALDGVSRATKGYR